VSTVLFVCVHNAGRSQMAAALLERAGGGRIDVRSAGTEPIDRIHPNVVEAMREVGVDLAGRRPRALDDPMVREADVVITMGCGDACPVYPGKRYEDWDLPDPAGKPLDDVRLIRDEIGRRVRKLADSLVGAAPGVDDAGQRA
jgi:arsenate reductase